jgi:hypothetical protein
MTALNFIENTYEGMRRICYGDEGATFVPVCEKCGRFVKADQNVVFTYDGPPLDAPNATCKKCGRVQMLFEGYI